MSDETFLYLEDFPQVEEAHRQVRAMLGEADLKGMAFQQRWHLPFGACCR